jgi:hypothetical protein
MADNYLKYEAHHAVGNVTPTKATKQNDYKAV